MSGLQVRGSPGDRHCGACTACCTYLPIPRGLIGPGKKPVRVPCPRVGALGCRRYARRPRACVDFACAWLRDSVWPKVWRPDRSGLLCLRAMLEGHLPAAVIYEIRSGALAKPEGNDIVNYLLRTTVALAILDAQGHRQNIGSIRAA